MWSSCSSEDISSFKSSYFNKYFLVSSSAVGKLCFQVGKMNSHLIFQAKNAKKSSKNWFELIFRSYSNTFKCPFFWSFILFFCICFLLLTDFPVVSQPLLCCPFCRFIHLKRLLVSLKVLYK